MLSPMMTVFVLVVLWLIVVVPMLMRRGDQRRHERSVAGFGRAMRALGRRARSAPIQAEVYTPTRRAEPARQFAPTRVRTPRPAAQEALMHPVDRTETSAARAQMMTRRRRSLAILTAGTLLFGLLGIVRGGMIWLLAAAFTIGLAGYLLFLRSQALRDRERRAERLARAGRRVDERSYDITDEPERFASAGRVVVSIDDDDLELQGMDTIDLTGVYEEAGAGSQTPVVERRAS